MQLVSFFKHRAWVRAGFYLLIYLVPILLSRINPGAEPVQLFLLTFHAIFLLTAWLEHVVILNYFLDKRQYGWAALETVGALAFFIGVRFLVEQVFAPLWLDSINYPPNVTWSYYIVENQYYALTAVGFGLLAKLIEDWFRHQQERSELVGEKTAAELAFLKSQVNPHFLFNTLNTIYSLAYTRSDEAPGAILKLSELMRYMLYDNEGPDDEPHKVALSREVAHLQNFVDLETLRLVNAQVQVHTEGNTDLYRIEPLLLLPFVENAFKHGDLTDAAYPLAIKLGVRQGKLTFTARNKKVNRHKDAVGGIGLQNVRRRLDLLYPDRYTLQIDDTPDSYTCRLELAL